MIKVSILYLQSHFQALHQSLISLPGESSLFLENNVHLENEHFYQKKNSVGKNFQKWMENSDRRVKNTPEGLNNFSF